MSTDRELLELAAKAAGYEVVAAIVLRDGTLKGVDIRENGEIVHYWHPLLDDRDALQLATTMRIEIFHGVYGKGRTDTRNHHGEYFTEQHFDDQHAATRRAIVRAAAAIGGRHEPA